MSLTQIGELDSDLAANVVIGGRRDADAPGFGDALEPRCDIDAVTKDIIAFDEDITKVDPNPEQHTPVLRYALIAFGHHRLHGYRAFDRIDHRGKLNQHTVAGGLDDTPTVFRYQRIGYSAVFAQDAGGADLVEPHQSRITGHVGGQYRRQSASDPSWRLLLHGTQISSHGRLYENPQLCQQEFHWHRRAERGLPNEIESG